MVDETLNKLDCTRSRNLIFERLSLWYRNYKRSAHRIENRVSTRDFCILNSPRRHVTTTNTASPCRKWNNYVVVRGLQRARYGRQWALRIEGRRSDYGLTALHAESLLSVIPSRGEREWERKREGREGRRECRWYDGVAPATAAPATPISVPFRFAGTRRGAHPGVRPKRLFALLEKFYRVYYGWLTVRVIWARRTVNVTINLSDA